VILETTRTTSATMRMEHKTNFPDLPPVTFSQRTQTPTIPLVSEGTMMDSSFKQEVKSQTESTQTQAAPAFMPQQPAAPFVPSVPFPFSETPQQAPFAKPQVPFPEQKTSALEFFENNLKNLPPLQDDKYTRFEDTVKGSKTYVHKQNEVKESFQSKLNEDLSYFNLVPEPPPEMGFMPKVPKAQPEKLVEKVKKLEEIHQASETPLSGTVFPQSFKKEEKFEKKEFLASSSVSTLPFVPPKSAAQFMQQRAASPFMQQRAVSPFVQQSAASPLPVFTPAYQPASRDQLHTPDPNFTRSASPKPSTEAVNMEKLWAMKPKTPEPFIHQQQQQHQQQSFSHEQKSSFVTYSSSQQSQMQEQQDTFVPIQPYAVEQQQPQEELPKASIKDTKSFFEQRIKQEEVKTHSSDLKAPGLVRQFAKPMVPLLPFDLEPGEAPEICYAPKPVLERKQSYVEKVEKSLEQNLDKEPERVPRGGVRILPQRQTPQRSAPSPSPQRFTAPSPKPVFKPEPMFKPEPIAVQQQPIVLQQQPQQQFDQYQSSEFRSENFESKKESTMGYRHVAPPTFAQVMKSSEPFAIPPMQFEAPKPFEATPKPFEPSKPYEAPKPFVAPKPQFQAPKPQQQMPQYQPPKQEPLIITPQPYQPREVPITVQPSEQPKPNLQQHAPVSQPKPYMTPRQKFNEFISETHETHSLYKNFVKSEENTHTSESYFQKIEQPKVAVPQQQFIKQEPPKPQFVPQAQQVRKNKKRYPDVML
jgi:hypothetical protein